MASSSTSSGQKIFTYDVFLSFRGEDVRKTFVDHLFAGLDRQGIYTYKDDERIKKGERINDELIKSIEDSRFFIIIFSKNYASSSWCLDELLKIMECHKTTEQKAYPVFYDVEPTEVRKQTGAVGKAFAKLKHKVAAVSCSEGVHHLVKGVCTCIPFLQGNSIHEHNGDVAVRKWREALDSAASLAGWELKNTADGHEAKVIQKMVEEISLELRPIKYSVDEKLVGMESRIKKIESILKIGTDEEVRMIGIKGMGGCGKTTLARAVYDHMSIHFECRSFVDNVREVSNNPLSGLKSLQRQVLSDVSSNRSINVSSVADGQYMMKMRLRGKKVLVVLDDVDHINQLEALAGEPSWFKSGSRIIITTRDEQVLKSHQVNWIHDVSLLLDEEAVSLFNRYAFGKEVPNEGYKGLPRKFVSYAAGLPLTIKVLGSSLCGKEELEWENTLERLKKIPLKETLEKLELSYHSLEDDYKEIFLDVACFLKGSPKDKAIKMLDSCGFSAISGLRVLERKSLITIKVGYRGEYLSMHDHLEEMGRNIVRREHPDEPNKHSRLWIHEEVTKVLANNLDNEATRCIIPDGRLRLGPGTLMKGLGSMKKLRVLVLENGIDFESFGDWNFDEFSQYFPNALCYLKWDWYPFQSLPETFQADNLVGLEIVQLWEGGEKKVCYNLKYLDLTYSDFKTLDLRLTPKLRQLHLKSCYKFAELQVPGCPELTSLELNDLKLKTLDVGLTPNLKRIALTKCDDLEEFHTHINGCRCLTDLQVTGSKLKTLDLTRTPNLKQLYLQRCDELVELHMHNNGSQELTNLLVTGSKLKTLDLTRAPNLKQIYLKECDELIEIHTDCNGYPELTDLQVNGSKLRSLDLTTTPKLNQLYLKKCDELIELHMHKNGCQGLTDLLVTGAKLKTLDLTRALNLKQLYLDECNELVEIHMDSNGYPELTDLQVNGSKLKSLDLTQTPKLNRLYLQKCDELVELHMYSNGYPKLTNLRISSAKLKTLNLMLARNLKQLYLYRCDELVELHMDGNGYPELTNLKINCSKLKMLDLMPTPKLKQLYLYGCRELVDLHMDTNGYPELTDLEIINSKLKTLELMPTPNLIQLYLRRCDELVELHIDSNGYPELTNLKISCSKLKMLDLMLSPKLKQLYLRGCGELVDLHMDINGYPELTDLEIIDSKLKTLEHMPTPNLKQLYLCGCNELEELHTDSNGYPELTYLKISGSKLKTLDLMLTPNLKSFISRRV